MHDSSTLGISIGPIVIAETLVAGACQIILVAVAVRLEYGRPLRWLCWNSGYRCSWHRGGWNT